MSKLIYVDTNVYMDYFLGRTDNLRPLGEFAFQLFKRARACEFNIVISSIVVDELSFNKISMEDLNGLKRRMWSKFSVVEADAEDFISARNLKLEKNVDFNDAMHIVLAKKAGAECIVTRNIKHFAELGINISMPESL